MKAPDSDRADEFAKMANSYELLNVKKEKQLAKTKNRLLKINIDIRI